MNFLEIINKCLLELNYKQVATFQELIKNDHKKLKQIINILNKEICMSQRWNFLLRKKELVLPQNTSELTNTIPGRILYLFIDGKKYNFSDDIEPFIKNESVSNIYSQFNDKLLFPRFSENKNIEVVYYTKNCVKDANNNEKENFELANDTSLIPMPFAEQLLVYGTCMRLKGNPQHVRFSYWVSMYKEALQNLNSKISIDINDAPTVNLHRF